MITKLQIIRDSVCLADDFAGPLDMVLEIDSPTLLSEIINTIQGSSFLQFAGPLVALSGGRALARVSSDGQIEYFANPFLPASECIADNKLEFRLSQADL